MPRMVLSFKAGRKPCAPGIPVTAPESDLTPHPLAAPGIELRPKVAHVLPSGELRRPDACLYLGLDKETLIAIERQGAGPRRTKRGGRHFYRKADLDAWLQETRAASQC